MSISHLYTFYKCSTPLFIYLSTTVLNVVFYIILCIYKKNKKISFNRARSDNFKINKLSINSIHIAIYKMDFQLDYIYVYFITVYLYKAYVYKKIV